MAVVLAPVSAWAASSASEKLYQKHCSACHGEKGNGQSRAVNALNPPPRNFTDPAVQQSLTRERMITSITHGRPGTAMVAWGNRLSAEQIEGIVDYIRANFMQTQAAPGGASASPHSQPHPASRAGPGANSRRVIPVNASLGERIYINNCAVCHGDKGAGAMWTQATFNPPPRKFASLQSREELTRERMINSVTYGRPDTAMMPFRSRLSDTEIAAVVDHIRETFMSDKAIAEAAAKASAANGGATPSHGHGGTDGKAEMPKPKPAPIVDADMSLPFPGGLAGDGAKGRDFYMANCFTCHGKAGDGEGPRSTFIRPKPRNFLHPDSRRTLNRPALFKAIANGKIGTVMPAWGKVLNDQEIANVAEFVFQEFIRPEEQKKKVSRN
ncbi:MAG: cytochrome c [Gammaproteobacteria bacterium]|nr:cytochrome c [Gammaproteobacteria bacterium]